MFTRHLVAAIGIVTCVASLCGCPNPNTYGTPRTLPPGKVQVMASLEGVGVSDHITTVDPTTGQKTTVTNSAYAPTLPSVGVRIGVADFADIGIRVAQLSSLGADFKLNFLKSRWFDMAVDPGVQAGYFGTINTGNQSESLGIFYFNLPLLLGINFSHSTTLILTPGFTYLLATASVGDTSGTQSYASGTAPLARLGVGFNFRIGTVLSIQPEITALRGFNDASATIWNFGVGFAIATSRGAAPDYSDVP